MSIPHTLQIVHRKVSGVKYPQNSTKEERKKRIEAQNQIVCPAVMLTQTQQKEIGA